MTHRTAFALICGLALAATGAPALAQSADLTETEILQRFQKQLIEGQKTRGLTIAPVGKPTDQPGATMAVTAATAPQILPTDQQVSINISFDFDSAALRADQKPRLIALCGPMQSMDGQVFRIMGHTDASGPEDYNQRLSKLRAEEVKRFLIAQCALPDDRLEATGMGEAFPLDPADPRADVNRRVEFQVIG